MKNAYAYNMLLLIDSLQPPKVLNTIKVDMGNIATTLDFIN
jgi:hypothetical protein